MLNYKEYDLIGIGDFSHGDNNVWKYRFNLLKNVIDTTEYNVDIYIEDTIEHTNNIINDEFLIFEKEYNVQDEKFPYGPLDRYSYRSWDSKIYLKIIKYIRENLNRINIIGVDVEEIARDSKMSQNILEKLNKKKLIFSGLLMRMLIIEK